MRKLFLTSAAAAALLWSASSPTPAWAAPIAAGSELSINGDDTFTATSITFTALGNVGGTMGDFTELANCNVCVTMIGTFTSGSTGNLYAVSDAGLTSSLVLSPPAAFTFIPGPTAAQDALNVTGNGTLTLTGFDPSPGAYVITTQGPTTAAVTFSATSAPVPTTPISEPSALSLVAGALLGLRWVAGRQRRSG